MKTTIINGVPVIGLDDPPADIETEVITLDNPTACHLTKMHGEVFHPGHIALAVDNEIICVDEVLGYARKAIWLHPKVHQDSGLAAVVTEHRRQLIAPPF